MRHAHDIENGVARLLGQAGIMVGLALNLSACSAGGPSGTASSTSVTSTTLGGNPPSRVAISGFLMAGPTCPVERIGQPCPPAPVRAMVVAIGVGGRPEASTHTEADGHYGFTLPPGSYTFVVVEKGGAWPRCPSTPVTVTSESLPNVDITCDTGIR